MTTQDNFIPAFVLAYSNSAFTNPHEAVLPDYPKDCTGDFTHMGAKYWGLESERHCATTINRASNQILYNHNRHNWISIRLKKRALVDEVTVSTKWYTGNQVRKISVFLIDELLDESQKVQVLNKVELNPDTDHSFPVEPVFATKALVTMYYEGGISRINFFGEIAEEQVPDRPNLLEQATISHVSNVHYGDPAMAVAGNREVMHMLGWESARTGFGESVVFGFDEPVSVDLLVVDTYMHRLNPPLSCHVYGLVDAKAEELDELVQVAPKWKIIFEDGNEVIPENFKEYMLEEKYLDEQIPNNTAFEIALHNDTNGPWKSVVDFHALEADTYHEIKVEGTYSHLLYIHYPNGGIHGIKLFGKQ
eukprot:TRINITY_DN7148_c0_g1_i1.p1 TRINITY_DN7148_c0_g1~~TRINITY_DN7148_c0_g1_i1.p1  ORF type:complete len:378 (-),score=79.30 TRINITY_DN7148_c0_g1_i1:23-1111(-)